MPAHEKERCHELRRRLVLRLAGDFLLEYGARGLDATGTNLACRPAAVRNHSPSSIASKPRLCSRDAAALVFSRILEPSLRAPWIAAARRRTSSALGRPFWQQADITDHSNLSFTTADLPLSGSSTRIGIPCCTFTPSGDWGGVEFSLAFGPPGRCWSSSKREDGGLDGSPGRGGGG